VIDPEDGVRRPAARDLNGDGKARHRRSGRATRNLKIY
jgi:hypothetical protein